MQNLNIPAQTITLYIYEASVTMANKWGKNQPVYMQEVRMAN